MSSSSTKQQPSSAPSSAPTPIRTGRKDDEYTDYSCSTSIERLARDVETLLRAWHVDKGNDRHISMARKTNTPTNATTTNANLSSPSSVTSQRSVSTSATNNTTSSQSTLLLRSDTLAWTVSLTTPTGRLVSVTVELQLCLWDSPLESHDHDTNNNDNNSGLPHSMRRSSQLHPMQAAVFENMSHLFGIGQHVTLTPHNLSRGSNKLYEAVQVGGALQFLTQSIIRRHGDDISARWNLYQVLTGWLQTALNCAVDHCHCCIPVFGFWGPYQPDLFVSHKGRQQRKSSQQSSSSAENYLSLFPSWMRDILHVELPGLPRMTRKHYLDIQEQQNNQFLPPMLTAGVLPVAHISGQFGVNVIPCAPQTPSRLTLWGNLLLQHCPDPSNDTVVLWTARHVFGWRKQPLVKATAFQMLFQPDNFQYDSQHNPYTAWRRKPFASSSSNSKNTTPTEQQQPIIDLTGEKEPTVLWGQQGDADSAMQLYAEKFEQYQDKCRTLGISLLDQAAGSTAAEPRWGPVDDPVASVHATVTWNGSPTSATQTPKPSKQPEASTTDPSNYPENSSSISNPNQPSASSSNPNDNTAQLPPPPRQPLLSFPLRIRSKHTMSTEDWVEMEESVERTILDPLAGGPACEFQVQTWWDLETPVASLAATQQCILAALIRTSTLPDETLLKHLTDDAVLEQWDNASGNVVAGCLANQAQVGASTKAIVEAMDWIAAAEDKMEHRDAEVLVRHILQPDNGSNFPMPPISPLSNAQGPTPTTPTASRRRRSSLVQSADPSPIDIQDTTTETSNTFAPLFKSAPIGRLVSILCVHLARVRSPCSMAMLWMAFCHEVRVRWEHRVALPHMNHVPGLDPSSLEMKERNRCLTTLGVKAEHAAYWHGPPLSKSACAVVQPDTEFPGDHHCLIGQKLQVVNLCIDMATAMEAQRQQRKQAQLEKRWSLEDRGVDDNTRANGIVKRKTNNGETSSEEGTETMENDGDAVMAGGSDRFEDALTEDEFLFETESASAIVAAAKRSMDLSKTPDPRARKGARCPVPGSSLVANGDQLYAPYLQRPYPLTDDVIAERHMMLSRHYEPSRASQNSISKRLEVSYRLQKPKLLSDMAAFKAANPGSIFQDFVSWYGNPASPLEEYSDTRNRNSGGAASIGDLMMGRASTDSCAVKLDKAHEAIQMLNETREFWSRTWEEATPIPASEQKLLFDVTSTVEMALDFMENMHPAILVNQVMAVNLAASYFSIVTAAKDVGVLKIGGLVQRAFRHLRERTEKALELLSGDATRSTSAACNGSRRTEGSSNFVSIRVISVCDEACAALSEAEVITARATSLLHKFPEQYGLVESILRSSPGEVIPLVDQSAQSQILQTIHKQQGEKARTGSPKDKSIASSGVRPAMREYVLRNVDDSHPCQLCVRFADESAMLNRSTTNRAPSLAHNATKGGMVLALTKSFVE